LHFPNQVGLSAGLDKNGDHIAGLGALGFGHLEIGTVTPRPQPGNTPPRMFRFPDQQALINRMGFNNKGVAHMVRNLQRRDYGGVLGVNIGKNFDTPLAQAADDYQFCLEQVFPYADYVTINLSSPNTPGLRELQFGDALDRLLGQVIQRRDQLSKASGRSVPLMLKVAPDMTAEDVQAMAKTVLNAGVDAIIATNTTLERPGVQSDEAGGLSGQPLLVIANRALEQWADALSGRIPLIGVGGIVTGEDALSKFKLGARLVQIYTGLIFTGPRLVHDVQTALLEADDAGSPVSETP
jgi:dihydroorotate dehydrogenase